MIITAYGDTVFDLVGIKAGLLPDQTGTAVSANVADSANLPAPYLGLLHGARTLTLDFQVKTTYPIEYTMNNLLGYLGLGDDEPRTLVGAVDADGTGTFEQVVEVEAVALPNFRWAGVATVHVDFLVLDDAWRAQTSETISHTTTHDSADKGMGVPVRGAARVSPIVRVKGAQRTVFSTERGWRYFKTRSLTNGGTETLWKYPYKIAVGDTAALVTATKALASGDDFRVWVDGEDIARELIDWNTASSSVWVLVNGLKPGETLTWTFVYGNASAGSPPEFAYPDLPAIDLVSSTNATWIWLTDETVGNAGLGLWWLSSGTGSPSADTDVPAAWRPWLMQENRDDLLQRRRSFYTASGTKYHAILDAERWREGATRYQSKGLADGVAIHHPLGATQLRADFRYENEATASGGSTAVGKFVIRHRRSSSDPWATTFEKSDVQATEVTVATANYTFSSPYPKHVYCGVVPNPAAATGEDDDDEIPQETRRSAFIRVRSKTTWELSIDSSLLTLGSLSGETNGWDTYGKLTWNFGRGTRPYMQLSFGGERDSGRLMIPVSNWLVFDAERRSAEEWDNTLTTKVGNVAFAVQPYKVVDVGGSDVYLPTSDWFPTRPRRAIDITAANLTFANGITGWTETFQHASADLTWATSSTAADGDSAAAAATVNSNTVVNDIIGRFHNTDADGKLTVVEGQGVLVVGSVRTTNLNLRPLVALTWYDASDVALENAYDENGPTALPATNTYYTKTVYDTAPVNAAYCRAAAAVYSLASGATGNCQFDAFFVDDPFVDFSFLDVGATVRVEWTEGWHG